MRQLINWKKLGQKKKKLTWNGNVQPGKNKIKLEKLNEDWSCQMGKVYLCSAWFKPDLHLSNFAKETDTNFQVIFFSSTGMSVGKHTSLSNGMRVKYLDISQTFFRIFLLFMVQFAFLLELTKFAILEFAWRSRGVLCHFFFRPLAALLKSVQANERLYPWNSKPRGRFWQFSRKMSSCEDKKEQTNMGSPCVVFVQHRNFYTVLGDYGELL